MLAERGHGPADQGRGGDVEAATAVGGADPVELGGVRQLDPGEIQFRVVEDDLDGGAERGTAERGPQRGVAALHFGGGGTQPGRVERSGQLHPELGDVRIVGGVAVLVVEQQALLERGEREQVGHARGGLELPISSCVSSISRSDGAAAGARLCAVRGEGAQCRVPQLGEAGGLGVGDQGAGPGPRDGELGSCGALVRGDVDLDGVRERYVGGVDRHRPRRAPSRARGRRRG